MKQKLLVTALGVALAGGWSVANADVQLYGQFDMSIDSQDVNGGGHNDINMNSNSSAIGVQGAEDLGGGLKAIFQAEWQVDLDDSEQSKSSFNELESSPSGSNSGLVGRDQWLGLAGGFGKLRLGTISTAYKSPAAEIDPLYRTSLESRRIGLQSGLHSGKGEDGQGRATNTVRYDSPKFGGVSLDATYTLDNNTNDGEQDNPYSVGAQFKNDMFYAFASYITSDHGPRNSATEAGAQINLGNMFDVRAIYEWDGGLITATGPGIAADGFNAGATSSHGAGSGADDGADVWSVGGDVSLGNNMLSVDYGQGTGNDAIDEYKTWRLAAQHMFSKQTKVYVGWANINPPHQVEDDIISLGLRHNF